MTRRVEKSIGSQWEVNEKRHYAYVTDGMHQDELLKGVVPAVRDRERERRRKEIKKESCHAGLLVSS